MSVHTGVGTGLKERLTDGSLAGRWQLDPARSTVKLSTKSMWGLVPVKGTFAQVRGEGRVDPDGVITGRLTVGAGSLDTRNKKRDEHLLGGDFFSASTYPEITFDLTGAEVRRPGLDLSGRLTVGAQTRPIAFAASFNLDGDREVAIDAEIVIDRSDYGLSWNRMGATSMKNTITLHTVFVIA